jgi:site-specific DNA recombinase
MAERRTFRCAVYTRVSTEYGLEQEFNSLDAQREACVAYIKSQSGEGWRLAPGQFNDGGYSGGSTERPALQALLQAIRLRQIDIVVVYKVDRLTRSLADFAKLVELFDQHGVSFVSVTQSFNTTSSMGRLTLNVLLSFAQFEREVTGERIRDKIAASKKKGLRVGGPVPLGYVVHEKKLVPEPGEANTVRSIFEGYLRLGSLDHLAADDVRTKISMRRDGSRRGGVAFRKGALSFLLRNRTYIGDIVHKGVYYKGEQQAIVPLALFEAVQARLDEQTQNGDGIRLNTGSPLTGLLFDEDGNRLTPATTNKKGKRYRYYVSASRPDEHGKGKRRVRVSAPDIEDLVQKAMEGRLLQGQGTERPATKVADFSCIERIVLRGDKVEVQIKQASDGGPDTLALPWHQPPLYKRRELIFEGAEETTAAPIRSETRARLVEGIALAKTWLEELLSGRARDTEEIAMREKRSERSVRMLLNLAFLPPAIVRAAVEGTLPRSCGITKLTEVGFDWGNPMNERKTAGSRLQ